MAENQNQIVQLEQPLEKNDERMIRYILPTDLSKYDTKRVAVYARVSRDGEDKRHSIEDQKHYLKQDVDRHPNWEFVGSYVDEGVTGTKLDRPEFNRLMHDARAGKIDIILTKSVSRFGRNLGGVLKVLHELQVLNVTVIFSNDDIRTDDPEALLRLQTQGLQAELEAKQTSKNQTWAIRHRFEKGLPTYSRVYGYEMRDHKYYVIPEEAKIVKRIFGMYLSGMGTESICKQLNAEGIPSPKGGVWQSMPVGKILDNEKYAGDLLLQKTYTADFLTKLRKNNHGEVPQYYIEDTHEPIIDRETFQRVKTERARRRTIYPSSNTTSHKTTPTNREPRIFLSILICGDCGKRMSYKRYKYGKEGPGRAMWICENHTKHGVNTCKTKSVREDILLDVTEAVLNDKQLIKQGTIITNEFLKSYIQKIVVLENQTLEYHFYDNDIITKTWQYESRKNSWTPEMRAKAREKAKNRIKEEK